MKHNTRESFMKTVTTLAILLFTFSSYAGEIINCLNPAQPGLSYVLNEIDYDHYDFKVSKKVLVPDSCSSRWGCDYEEKIIFTDKLKMTDFQRSMVFESKRTYIEMEDWDNVQYIYTAKAPNGKFESKSVTLKCNN